ncbi:hypothetical protein RvY_08441 [Ramazzottius varieornatus]|uniref:Reverse transcriptase domain-containing protein n=1 Tax=Ramazzottius varieornatus TaxID=947166 RepID=A0A1D1V5S7_RAMVA|nr:hypothetical protein RvY_08441 [Ramazzottius varieornatus]
MEAMGVLVRPQQLGYGTKGGAEAVVHATRAFLEHDSTCQVLLKLDFRNASNTLFRDRLLQEVLRLLSEFFPFVYQLYRQPSNLLYGEHVLQSACSVQQGDPLGPLLFCLATRSLSKSLTSPFNLWYLDDATLGGTLEQVSADLQTVISAGAALGLQLNMSKCEVFAFGETVRERTPAIAKMKVQCPGILLPESHSLTLLGAPLFPEAIPKVLDGKTALAELMTLRLEKISSHQALFLLKSCLSIPKLLYVLRCSPAYKCQQSLRHFDDAIRSCAAKIANIDMNDDTWRQASLPVANGGLRLRCAAELALPAYLASVHAAHHLVSQIVPEADLDGVTAEGITLWSAICDVEPPPSLMRSLRKMWDTPIVERQFRVPLEQSTPTEKARLHAVSSKESGAWLDALPVSVLGNLLDDNCFRISVGLRLGAKLCEPHACRCGVQVDGLGRHGLACKNSAGRHSRHDALNDIIHRALTSCQVHNIREPNGLLRDDGRRPDGLTLVPWCQGKALAWDVTVVDTLGQTYLQGSTERVGFAANQAEEKKRSKYVELEGRYLFCAVGFETFGVFGNEARDLIQKIGKKIMDRTGEPRSLSS